MDIEAKYEKIIIIKDYKITQINTRMKFTKIASF